MRHRVPDISKLQAAIGYKPEVQLEEILRRTLADMKGSVGQEGEST